MRPGAAPGLSRHLRPEGPPTSVSGPALAALGSAYESRLPGIGVLVVLAAIAAFPSVSAAAVASGDAFIAHADAICLGSAAGLEQDGAAVDRAITAFVAHDSADSRHALGAALTTFFLSTWEELGRLNQLPGPAAYQARLRAYVAAAVLEVQYAKPFIAAVEAGDALLVHNFAAGIALLAEKADAVAQKAGLLVCGSGQGYVLRLNLKQTHALGVGTPIRIQSGRRTIAAAGEVLDVVQRGGRTLVLVAVAEGLAPLHGPAAAEVLAAGGVPYIKIVEGSERGPRLAYDATIA